MNRIFEAIFYVSVGMFSSRAQCGRAQAHNFSTLNVTLEVKINAAHLYRFNGVTAGLQLQFLTMFQEKIEEI